MEHQTQSSRRQSAIALGALGVVFGDIGTSPLYALRECFIHHGTVAVSAEHVLGVLSLILWALIFVISIKYVLYIMRADNHGEGGQLAQLALINPRTQPRKSTWARIPIYMGLFGAALLYGDGVITPAISVLSAMEGLNVATPIFKPMIIPFTLVILGSLFFAQSRGTTAIGKVFGPIILVWFVVIGVLGIRGILLHPGVLEAINPLHAISLVIDLGWKTLAVLGGVFLAVTGGEALYADMGHFGRKPIQMAWFYVALPGLVLNYFGQGALLLNEPEAIANPFYHLAPDWALYPMVGLAALATVIASQAVISGAFSVTRQAVQLGYFPRIQIQHTASDAIGQIYVPLVNRLLAIVTMVLVLQFRTSSNLAGAYGIAVSTTMVITTILMYFIVRQVWGWNRWKALALTGFFLAIDIPLFSANALKIFDGGWVPLVLGLAVLIVMTTWRRGREILAERLSSNLVSSADLVRDVIAHPPHRVPGIAVFLSRNVEVTPPALVHHLAHNKVLHEIVVLLAMINEEVPSFEDSARVEISEMGAGFYKVKAHYGFMESPNVRELIRLVRERGLDINPREMTYFVGRETVISGDRPEMSHWRGSLFAFMSRNAERAPDFFKIPRTRVIEIGMQVEV